MKITSNALTTAVTPAKNELHSCSFWFNPKPDTSLEWRVSSLIQMCHLAATFLPQKKSDCFGCMWSSFSDQIPVLFWYRLTSVTFVILLQMIIQFSRNCRPMLQLLNIDRASTLSSALSYLLTAGAGGRCHGFVYRFCVLMNLKAKKNITRHDDNSVTVVACKRFSGQLRWRSRF